MSRPDRVRCGWAGTDPLYVDYHDREWGVPVHDERRLFEFLILEGAQAGLSWITILRKRDGYREAFDEFDPERIARYDSRKIERLLKNPNIVRNRLKVAGTVRNARAFLALVQKESSFDRFLWSFVGGSPIVRSWKTLRELPAETEESRAMSRALKKRDFTFVGPTICYAFMQATGMVNDHLLDCFRRSEVSKVTRAKRKRSPKAR